MNVQNFTYLLQHPNAVVSSEQTKHLEDILDEYPYFQAARALHLKGLKTGNSFKYNKALKVTAAYTADRDVLFDFVTSDVFLQNAIADTLLGKTEYLVDKELISEEVFPVAEEPKEALENVEDKRLKEVEDDTPQFLVSEPPKSKVMEAEENTSKEKTEISTDLGLGKPLTFTKDEKYSFGEWLQLTSLKTVDRNLGEKAKLVKNEAPGPTEKNLKKKKFERIDKFISDNPKIVPQANPSVKIDIKASTKFDKNELMTETLAKVYLEQKKYKKAIQAYRILSLKYPEKSGFFADRIRAVERLKADNTLN